MIGILFILTIIALMIEYSRNKWSSPKKIFNNYFFSMLRKSEYEGYLTGATWLLVGCILTIYIFPIKIAVAAILVLTIGDALAAIIGKAFPVLKVGEKSLFGTFFGVLVTFWMLVLLDIGLKWEIILIGSIFGMLVELMPNYLNDNLTIPIVSGFAMMLGSQIL
jgi:dolichol kinase